MVNVLYFSAPWCSPCKVFGPALEQASEKLGFSVQKVNVEEDTELMRQYDVMSLPTTVWFKNGVPLVAKSGPLSFDAIGKVINNLGV